MKKFIICAMASLFLVAASNVSYGQTKKKKTVTVQSKTVEANRGENPNIKSSAPTEDKAEEKSRSAAACSVFFDNYTGLYVNIYVDGYYKGQLSPYGSGTVTVGNGYTTIYCISAGGTRDWSASGDCREAYTYTLK